MECILHGAPCNISPLFDGKYFLAVSASIKEDAGEVADDLNGIGSGRGIGVGELLRGVTILPGRLVSIPPGNGKVVPTVRVNGDSDLVVFRLTWIVSFPDGDKVTGVAGSNETRQRDAACSERIAIKLRPA